MPVFRRVASAIDGGVVKRSFAPRRPRPMGADARRAAKKGHVQGRQGLLGEAHARGAVSRDETSGAEASDGEETMTWLEHFPWSLTALLLGLGAMALLRGPIGELISRSKRLKVGKYLSWESDRGRVE